MQKVAVIMAGGGGTRFWPLSRQNKPKQLLNLTGKEVMINETILRYEGLISPQDTLIVTNQTQSELLEEILIKEMPRENILKEPLGRNTAACILYAALVIQKRYGDAVISVLPADHYFQDLDGFKKVLGKACQVAEQTDKLLTIGIKPTFPATGYGYIKFNQNLNQALPENVYSVAEFVEKPDFEKAKKYLESGSYLWNSGMFVWKASVILENFERYLPRIYHTLAPLAEVIDTDQEASVLAELYPKLQSISIDYGIMERSDQVLVIPGDFGWNDVGSWDALGAIFPPDEQGNIIQAQHLGIETKNSIIYGGERLIATIGMSEVIIADTNDALLICPKDKAQEVKVIVDLLKEKGMLEYF